MQHLYTAALLCFTLTRSILRLATFSLERLRCCTLIGGSWAAPCVAGKTISGITVPSAQWAHLVSCWCISFVLGLPCFSLYFCLFSKVSSNLEGPIKSTWNKISPLKVFTSYFIYGRGYCFTFYIIFNDDWVHMYKYKKRNYTTCQIWHTVCFSCI